MAPTTTRTEEASPDADAASKASDLVAREADVVGTPLGAEAALPVGAAAPRPPTREERSAAAGLDGNFIEYSRESWEFLSWSDGVLVVA